jgi:hypothetical protein
MLSDTLVGEKQGARIDTQRGDGIASGSSASDGVVVTDG